MDLEKRIETLQNELTAACVLLKDIEKTMNQMAQTLWTGGNGEAVVTKLAIMRRDINGLSGDLRKLEHLLNNYRRYQTMLWIALISGLFGTINALIRWSLIR